MCVICRDPVFGYGHNAEPFWNGKCCDACNVTVVIPYRLILKREEDAKKEARTDGCAE
jgi:hypothetical protein